MFTEQLAKTLWATHGNIICWVDNMYPPPPPPTLIQKTCFLNTVICSSKACLIGPSSMGQFSLNILIAVPMESSKGILMMR